MSRLHALYFIHLVVVLTNENDLSPFILQAKPKKKGKKGKGEKETRT